MTASLDSSFVENLLSMSEGDVLDFKREQYPLTNDDEKGELIKDLLAFANGWRMSDAFILVGVAERTGARAEVLGLTKHLKDADLQQLVNSKTNVPIAFEYRALQLEGMTIGLLRVDKNQQRPIFLKGRFGRLRPNVVYIRRGSGTAEADPTEIFRMGVAASAVAQSPSLAIELNDPVTKLPSGDAVTIVSKVLTTVPNEGELPSELREALSPVFVLAREMQIVKAAMQVRTVDDPSPKDLIAYEKKRGLLQPLILLARNLSGPTILDARVVLRIPRRPGLKVSDKKPVRPSGLLAGLYTGTSLPSDVAVTKERDGWVVELRFGKIQPGADVESDPLWIGCDAACDVHISARVFADNLAQPVDLSFSLTFRVEHGWLDHDGAEIPVRGELKARTRRRFRG